MNKVWNINIILCEKSDADVINIKNIFDTLHIRDNKASFSMVTFANGIKIDEENVGLYYFIEKIENDSRKKAYLGNVIFRCENDDSTDDYDGEENDRIIVNTCNITSVGNFEDIEFQGPGRYEIRVYKYDNTKAISLTDKSQEECAEWANEDNLVSIYPFKVKLIDEGLT